MKKISAAIMFPPETLTRLFRHFPLLVFALCFLMNVCWATSAAEGVGERTMSAVEDTTETVKDEVESIWNRVDEARLVNRTPDEIVAWVIVGVMVGSLAGMFTRMKSTGGGKLARLLIGLIGAFIGGIVVSVTDLDLGWGPVLIRYEELVFATAGAILLILIFRLMFRGKKEK